MRTVSLDGLLSLGFTPEETCCFLLWSFLKPTLHILPLLRTSSLIKNHHHDLTKMGLHWSMPVYREPLWIKTLVNDSFLRLQTNVALLTSGNDTFPHWLHDLQRHYLYGFSVTFGIGIILTALSYLSSWRHRRIAASQTVQAQLEPSSTSFQASSSSSSLQQISHGNTTPLTPPPHGPMSTGSRVSPPKVDKYLNSCTVSTSEHRTPFVRDPSQRNFSGLAKTAPVSYDTLQRNGMLNLDGTPTKKCSPGSSKSALGSNREDHFYDGPTEVPHQVNGQVVHWIDDRNGGRLHQFSAAKGKWKAS